MGNCLGVQEQSVDEAPVLTHHHAQAYASKEVRFSGAEVGSPSLRVKLVISKQKLKEMIAGGGVSIEGMVSEVMMVQTQLNEVVKFDCYEDCKYNSDKAWKPALKSIPEAECYS